MIGKRSSDSCWNLSIEYSWTISPKHFNAAILYVGFSFLHSLYIESNTWRKETKKEKKALEGKCTFRSFIIENENSW